jgi:two-component system LytT family sensor kinase
LRVDIEMEPGTNSALILRLLLQPIIENAIEHGIRKSNGAGEVKISAKRSNGILQLTVRDSGPGVSALLKEKTSRKGIGLSVTRQRLQQFYGAKHRFRIGNAQEGGFFVQMEIPWQEVPGLAV